MNREYLIDAMLGQAALICHGRNGVVMASATAWRKTFGHQSSQVVTRRQALSVPDMIIMIRLRRR